MSVTEMGQNAYIPNSKQQSIDGDQRPLVSLGAWSFFSLLAVLYADQ